MLFFKDYLIRRFGRPLHRVPIDLPYLCPQRLKDSGGRCIFCAEDGALARHLKRNLNLREQVDSGISYLKRRHGEGHGLIAYFQTFTNTNAPLEAVRRHYEETLSLADFAMLITATRPDCLPDETVGYLAELNRRIETWVELGVQTANERTLELIRRGHGFACVEDAVRRLDAAGIRTAAHVIIGLPGETAEDYRATAVKIAALPFSAVKIHNLLILKDTPLSEIYSRDKSFVHPMNEYEYAGALLEFLKHIPPEWPLMRISADADPGRIIAPKWWMKKGQFIEYVRNMAESGSGGGPGAPRIRTNDGSYTFFHPAYGEHFHTTAGAKSEAHRKFIEPCGIRGELETGREIRMLDVGFGLGYNAMESARLAEEVGNGRLIITSLEKDPETAKFAESAHEGDGFYLEILDALRKQRRWSGRFSCIDIIYGDARATLKELLIRQGKFDFILLDPFSPGKNPELWTYDFIRILAGTLADGGIIATYSAAYPVRGALMRCGFAVGESRPFGRKRGGTLASKDFAKIAIPITEKETGIICKSTAGAAYRDPQSDWPREKILEHRRRLMRRLRARGVPKWFKI